MDKLISHILFLVLLLPIGAFGHDMKMAYFSISKIEGSYILQINIDRDDFLLALQDEPSLEGMKTEKQAAIYLSNHFKLKFDGADVSFSNWEFKYETLLIRAKATIKTSESNIAKIEAFNDCLLDRSKKQNNILVVKLHDKVRSFRLHHGRKSTIVEY